MREARRPSDAVITVGVRAGAAVVTVAGETDGAADAAAGASALPVAARRPAASSGVTIRDRMRVDRDMVEVDMGIPSHACEVSCRVRAKAARPLSRLHPEDRCRPGYGSPT